MTFKEHKMLVSEVTMLAAFQDFTKVRKQNERRTKASTSDNELSLTYRITLMHFEENLSLFVAGEPKRRALTLA